MIPRFSGKHNWRCKWRQITADLPPYYHYEIPTWSTICDCHCHPEKEKPTDTYSGKLRLAFRIGDKIESATWRGRIFFPILGVFSILYPFWILTNPLIHESLAFGFAIILGIIMIVLGVALIINYLAIPKKHRWMRI